MIVKKPFTNDLRQQINLYKKNGTDISFLIKDKTIKGEDLSYCKINNLYCVGEDISGTNFSNAEIKAQFQKAIAHNCNFKKTIFLPGSSLKYGDFRGSNFEQAVVMQINYSHGDFRGCNLCNATMTLGDGYGSGAKIGLDNFRWLKGNDNV